MAGPEVGPELGPEVGQDVRQRTEAERLLKRLATAPDHDIGLAEGALALAALAIGELDLDHYRDHLAGLAEAVSRKVAGKHSLAERVATLNQVIVEQERYCGDTAAYDDLDNANLVRVIDRRRGLPVALGIIYLDVAHRIGWDASGLNFPGHFLIRIEDGETRAIVDPFEGGAIRDAADLRALIKRTAGENAELAAEHYQPVDRRSVLLRLQNNIKVRQIRAGRIEDAAGTVERMLLFMPEEAMLQREAGLLHARLGHLVAARLHLESYRDGCQSASERAEVEALLRKLSQQLN